MDSFASLIRLYDAFLMEVRVAELQICRDSACSFSANPELPNPHLLVNLVDIPLHRDYATAISYAWGEFDRQKRTFGHTFHPGKHVQLELGTEWIISDVVDRLVELSEEKPIWMDQLCIPQQEEKILKILADIPSIFRTLDVVVLFPGSLCGCVPKLIEELRQFTNDDQGQEDQTQVLALQIWQGRCLSTGASSWGRRMWTFQELMHSQRVRCVWASKIENPCVLFDDPDINVENLPPFQRRMLETRNKDFVSQDLALKLVSRYLTKTRVSMSVDLTLYQITTTSLPNDQVLEQYCRFMIGEQLIKPPSSGIKVGEVRCFLGQLSARVGDRRGSSRTRRVATHPRDYILSIWTGCPDYTVPKDYKSMHVAELMQDALNQLRCNHEAILAVTAPHGLFDGKLSGSAVWNPLEYLSEVDPSCEMDLYRALAFEGVSVTAPRWLGNCIPVILHDTAQHSLSKTAMDYTMLVDHLNKVFSYGNEDSGNLSNSILTRMVIKLLHRTMSYWGNNRAETFQYAIEGVVHQLYTGPLSPENLLNSRTTDLIFRRIQPTVRYLDFLFSHRGEKDIDDAYSQELEPLIDLSNLGQVYDVVYYMVAAALELDVDYCEKRNVKLIFSSLDNDERRPPRVGLCRGDVDTEDIVSGRRKTITVSIGGREGRPSTLLYEAVRVDPESDNLGRPAYQVFAVWVPTESIADGEFGAFVTWQGHDSLQKNVGVLV